MGRLGSLAAVAVASFAFASSAQAKPLLGIRGDLPRFTTLTGQKSTVHQAFLGWGQGLSYGSSFTTLLGTLGPIPMIHLGTGAGVEQERGDHAGEDRRGRGRRLPLRAEPGDRAMGRRHLRAADVGDEQLHQSLVGIHEERCGEGGHSPADYRKAFARIYLILHGGSAATIRAKLKTLGLPGIAKNLPSNPFPRLRIVWDPIAGGNPRIPANQPENYYPGNAYVDVDGGDIFDETLGDTAPWSKLEALYTVSVQHGKPFAVPEWGLFGVDDDTFTRHMCTFLKTHARTEEAGFFESRAGTIFDLEPKPKSRAVYPTCITPLGAAVPGWAHASGGTTKQTGPSVTFTPPGKPSARRCLRRSAPTRSR